MSKQFNLGRLFVELEVNTKGIEGELGKAEKSFDRFTKFVEANPKAALGGLALAAGAAALHVAAMADEVDAGMRRVAASLPDATGRMGDLKDVARDLAIQYGVSQIEIVRSMEEIAKGGVDSTDDLIAATKAVQLAVKATGEETGTVVGILDKTLDAFGLSAAESERVLAKLFVTAQGRTNLAELSTVMDRLAPLASAAGAGFDVTAEAVAGFLAQGYTARQVVSELTDVIDNEGAPGLQRLAAQSTAASDGLQEMRDAAERNGNTMESLGKKAKEQLNAVLIDLGRLALPPVVLGLKALNTVLGAITGSTDRLVQSAASAELARIVAEVQKLDPTNLRQQADAYTRLMASLRAAAGVRSDIGSVGVAGNLGGVVSTFGQIQEALRDGIGTKPVEELRAFRDTLAQIVATGKNTPANLKEIQGLVALINKTIRDRGQPIVSRQDIDNTTALTEAQRAAVTASKNLDAQQKQALLSAKSLSEAQRSLVAQAVKESTATAKRAGEERAKVLEAIQRLSNESELSLLNEQGRAYTEVTRKFQDEIAKLTGEDRTKAEAALKTAQENLLLKWSGFNKELTPAVTHGTTLVIDNSKLQGAAMDDLGGDLDDLNARTGRLTDAQIEAARKSKAWRDELVNVADEITGAAQKVQELAHNLEPLFGSAFVDQIDQAVGAISQMGDAVKQIATGNILGGVTQGVGALVSLGKTIFGSSNGLGKALHENNDRLRELRSTMGDLIDVSQSGREIVGIQTALQRLLPTVSGKLDSGERQRLDRELVRVGLDRQALNDLAEALGIRIRDDNGDLQTDLLRNLLSGIRDLDTAFAETFRGQRDRISQGVSIGSITDELGEAVALLRDPKLGSSAIAGALGSFDLTDNKGRLAAVNALQDLFANIGSVGVGGLGGLNRAEFADAIQWLVDLLTAANETAAEAAETPVKASTPTSQEPAPVTLVDPTPSTPLDVALPDDAWADLLELTAAGNDTLDKLLASVDASLSASANEVSDQLEEMLAELASFKPVPPPVLSADMLKTLTAPSTNTVNMTVSIGDIVIHLPPGLPVEDPRALAAELSEAIVERVDEALARRHADAAILRGDSRR